MPFSVIEVFEKLSRWPFGKYIFSKVFCFFAPYFGSINLRFEKVASGECVAFFRKRRAVLNHIKTIHAIAMCNLAEAVGGLCMEASLPKNLRWIPKGMTVEYLAKATTDVKAYCKFDPNLLKVGENSIEVNIYDKADQKVFRAEIDMYVSEKKALELDRL